MLGLNKRAHDAGVRMADGFRERLGTDPLVTVVALCGALAALALIIAIYAAAGR